MVKAAKDNIAYFLIGFILVGQTISALVMSIPRISNVLHLLWIGFIVAAFTASVVALFSDIKKARKGLGWIVGSLTISGVLLLYHLETLYEMIMILTH
ncbi:hypothetical protein [Bacillus sp. FJAT-44742]|uniref:hypothetical protein n=1 Tax=Bacillus sp. FJAT-44742 TaxID=2014005 RepID=UPI000C24345C|nr:hypothetical protein [Bacillus sp. FJAT-44742]